MMSDSVDPIRCGNRITLRAEAGSIIPAGRHTVSRVNPDGSFHVGGNTAVWPARVEEDAPVTDPKPETHESLAKRLEAGGARFTEIDTTLHEIRELLKPLPEMQADIAKTREIVEAWADMALLAKVLAYEAALRRLAEPEVPEDERAELQTVVDAAEPAVIDLYGLRNPQVHEALPA